MSATSETGTTRNIEQEYTIKAPPEAVWKALTDAEELVRWFPMEARVKPGVGGSIYHGWSGEFSAEMPIEIWEPNKHLRMHWPAEKPEEAPATPIALDFYIEGRGGETVLRMVHSGFSPDASWDEIYDGIRRGWSFELRGLRHYLEHHLGTPRLIVWAKRKLGVTLDEAWKRLTGSGGLDTAGALSGVSVGDRYDMTTSTGDRLAGEVYILSPPKDFCATIENMNRGLLRLRLDKACGPDPTPEVNLWISTYGIPQEDVQACERRFIGMLEKLYPKSPAN